MPVKLERVSEFVWEIPREGGMKVPGRVYVAEQLSTGSGAR